MDRRNFLHQLSHAMAMPAFLPSFLRDSQPFGALDSWLSDTSNAGRILVLLKMNGGNDGLNTVIPLDQMDGITSVRSNIYLPENKVIDLQNHDLGLHTAMTGFKDLFDESRLKIVQNVGYPNPDFSHFRSMDIWESASNSDEYFTSGWMGRYLEERHPQYPEQYPNDQYPHPLSIELSGSNSLLFTGDNYFTSYIAQNPDDFQRLLEDFQDNYPETHTGDKLSYIDLMTRQTNDYGDVVKDAHRGGFTRYGYNNNYLGRQFDIITKLIDGGLNTRVYLVSFGGFDTHDNQVDVNDTTQGQHAYLLGEIDKAVHTFMRNMDYSNRSDDVLLMTYSEFGRTIIANGANGTDHGTAAPLFVVGNKVNSNILGSNPQIDPNFTYQDNLPSEFDFRQIYKSVINQWLHEDDGTAQTVLKRDFDEVAIIKTELPDSDQDGVPDEFDLCPDTPLGAVVNLDGCEVFGLAVDNYIIETVSNSCAGKQNGQINIAVVRKDINYNLSIDETVQNYSLNADNDHQLAISQLGVGIYTLTFTVEGEDDYSQKFELNIDEPPVFTTRSSVSMNERLFTANLSGSNLYFVEVNGNQFTTNEQKIELPLETGMNNIRIHTPQDCQGIYEESVFVSAEVRYYPNPVGQELFMYIPGEDSQLSYKIFNSTGSGFVEEGFLEIPYNRTCKLAMSNKSRGLYYIQLKSQEVNKTIKVVKS